MKIGKKYVKRIILTVLLIVSIFTALWLFIQDNTARIGNQNEEYIGELTIQRAISIDNLISENLTFIRSTAYLYGQSLTSPWADVAVIRDYEENSAFDMLRFIDTSGDNYTSRGVQANLSDRDYFQAGMRGESGVTYVLVSRVTGQRQIGFYAPVYYQHEIIGVMVGFYGEEYIDKLLSYELFGYGGEGWLCTRDGTVLGSTVEGAAENYFAYLRDTGKCEEKELSRVMAAFSQGEDISFAYQEDNESAIGYAVALSQAEWALIRNFPASASRQILSNANREGMVLIIALVIFFALYGALLGIDVMLEQRRTKEANQNANDVSTGVSRLFEKFTAVDLRTGEYNCIAGSAEAEALPLKGGYTQLAQAILDRITEEKQKKETADFIAIDHLKSVLTDNDSISLRVHAPVGGAEWFTYNFIVIEREGQAPSRILIARQDVTALRHKEEEKQQKLQEALAMAESASRAKTEFLFNMSHDLRTPMNAIIGYTELAQQEGVSENTMREYIRKIDSSSVHLLSLINDILEMSCIESGKITLAPEKTDLVDMLQDAQELFSAQTAKKQIAFQVNTSHVRDRWVMCDKNRLNRIILNLISNACKFTEAGGKISVTLEQIGPSAATGDYALRVQDTGIGMGPEFVSKLFAPFERERTSTVSKTQGTGLGLSITKKFVDMMGGSIDVNTEQGKGTEFIVYLRFPIVSGEEENRDEGDGKARTIDFSKARLLLVEDNEINREIASMILTQNGFMLETAENGQIAVEKVAASAPGYYDAVLMDIQMPVMDGYTAARAIRNLENHALASVPIVAMTANAFQEDIQNALNAGMNGHIAKPLDVDKMLDTLLKLLVER